MIKFECSSEVIDFGFTLPVPLVGLTLVGESHCETNSLRYLIQLGKLIKEYIDHNNVILYYYCDTEEVRRSHHNLRRSPQAYRNELFAVLFDRMEPQGLVRETNVIVGEHGEEHYLVLITRDRNQEVLREIKVSVADWSKE